MSFTRRTFLIGAGTGISVLALAACTVPDPTPSPTPTRSSPFAVPEPAKLWRSSWSADPFAKGAVSYLPVGSTPEDRAALRVPLQDRVFFAGEATSDAPGTVKGAIASGARAAREVMDAVTTNERIAIVGAGAAGAEAARLLTALGLEVIVVEARDRVGGRIDSRSDDDTSFELGAWRLASEGDSSLVADLDTVPLEGDLALPGATATAAATAGLAELTAIAAAVSARLEVWASEQSATDTGLTTGLEESGASGAAGAAGDIPPESMPALYAEAARIAAGADPADISTWFPPAGLGEASVLPTSALSAIVISSLDGVTVALSTAVVAIAYDDEGVSLRLGTGDSRRVDRVIVTLPLGVLKSGAVGFDPPLPLSTRSAIDAVGVGDVELVRVAFEEAFWTTDATVWSLVGTEAPIATWINLQPLTGETTLLGIAAGEAAASLSDLDDAALSRMVREQLAPFAS